MTPDVAYALLGGSFVLDRTIQVALTGRHSLLVLGATPHVAQALAVVSDKFRGVAEGELRPAGSGLAYLLNQADMAVRVTEGDFSQVGKTQSWGDLMRTVGGATLSPWIAEVAAPQQEFWSALQRSCEDFLDPTPHAFELSQAERAGILRVARTIAFMSRQRSVQYVHLTEAMLYMLPRIQARYSLDRLTRSTPAPVCIAAGPVVYENARPVAAFPAGVTA